MVKMEFNDGIIYNENCMDILKSLEDASVDKKINNCGTIDILSIPNIKQKKFDGSNYNDTEKPVELMKILIENSSQVGDIVLEPFMGIGATCVAAHQCGRRFIGCELDEDYFEISRRRLQGEPLDRDTTYNSLW